VNIFWGWGREDATHKGRKKGQAPERELQNWNWFNTLLLTNQNRKK
jgi:hypothetical protein